jgi:hypothetical protein
MNKREGNTCGERKRTIGCNTVNLDDDSRPLQGRVLCRMGMDAVDIQDEVGELFGVLREPGACRVEVGT